MQPVQRWIKAKAARYLGPRSKPGKQPYQRLWASLSSLKAAPARGKPSGRLSGCHLPTSSAVGATKQRDEPEFFMTAAEIEHGNVLKDLAQTSAGKDLNMELLKQGTRRLQARLMAGVESEALQSSKRLQPSK
ncbi:hypothetical protein WJX84_006936 [Apatococcus fuscideae]|uniref:Uncharacterized protein n=1 Tax=Apatococcus fuscideae TaxID=2026836 RepID=A0AAW1RJN0_9CHLO